jgi:hypothetical protein
VLCLSFTFEDIKLHDVTEFRSVRIVLNWCEIFAAVSAVGDQGGRPVAVRGVLGLLPAGGTQLRGLCERMHVG